MSGQDAREVALVKGIERANRDLALMRDEALRIASALPWTARGARLHLESLALRLDTVIDGLTHELMAGPDPSSVRLLARLAGRALKIALPALAILGAGAVEGVSSDIYRDLRGHAETCEISLSSANRSASDFGHDAAAQPLVGDSEGEPPTEEPANGFSGKAAADIVGITYRQLDYWARTDLIRPELADRLAGSSRRRYSFRNLLELKLVKTMLDTGIKLESVRDAFAYLRSQGSDISTARLLIAGDTTTLVIDDSEMVDVVNRLHSEGKAHVSVVTLDGLRRQVEADMAEVLAPPSGPRPDAIDRQAGP